jgi:hypothetical protein
MSWTQNATTKKWRYPKITIGRGERALHHQ